VSFTAARGSFIFPAVTNVIDRTLVVGPFQCNCRIVVCERTGNAVVIDPGDEPHKIAAEIDAIAAELRESRADEGAA
jgi:glyoxylase-like metal-dependent hydrolase (beta-lactamase superfamily II)